MPDREKVIKGLEYCTGHHSCSGCGYYDPDNARCQKDLMRDALAILLEQDAVKPREQEETRTWTVCGNCSQHLISKWLWCPYCGKRVKWDDK